MAYQYDPELSAAADMAPVLDVRDPGAVRRLLTALGDAVPPYRFPEQVSLGSEIVPVPGGSTVEVRVIRPRAGREPAPALLWFHGGGFVFGDAAMDFPLHAHLAERLGAVVVSVEYSLAPENPYPVAIDEGYAVLDWIHATASALGIDRDRIAIGGHSAGGCLAAAVALMARDRSGPELCLQALDLPVTDDRGETESMRAFTDTPIWDSANAQASWLAYLGGRDAGELPYAAPARAATLSGLPPAYVAVAEFDPLRDEGIDYAQRLVQAGVSTELHLFPGTFHGSVAAVPGAVVSTSMVDHLADALGRAFARSTVAATAGSTS